MPGPRIMTDPIDSICFCIRSMRFSSVSHIFVYEEPREAKPDV